MSEWSYSDEELDEYFSNKGRRSPSSGAVEDRPTRGLRGFFYQRFDDPRKAQAGVVLSVIVGLGLVAVLGLGLYLFTLTGELPSTQRLENPQFQLATVAYTADGEELARYARQNRSWANYRDISPHVINALVATEDRRFHQHWGMDLRGVAAAIADMLTGGDLRGASTISQQLARNLYDEQIGRAVTLERKLKEALTAVQLERRYTKREIIEMYLNTVEFGNNAFGIEAAAQTFYGTDAAHLSELQAATLVGMLKAITYYNPVRNPDNAKQRRNVVLALMRDQGYISEAFYADHADDPVNAEYRSAELYASMAPYFAEHVRQWMERWARENGHDLYADGLRVYTTLDAKLQEMARASVDSQMTGLQAVAGFEWSRRRGKSAYSTNMQDYVEKDDYEPFSYFWQSKRPVVHEYIRATDRYQALRDRGVSEDAALQQLYTNEAFADSLINADFRLEAGFVSIDPRNGHVKTWIGGRDFRQDQYDKVALAKRQPGSTFKPFVYTTAIDNGYSPYDTLLDSTFTYTDPVTDSTWSPSNFGEASGEMMTLSQGLARSRNTITGRLMLRMGPSNVAFYANRMGIQSTLQEVPSLALGTSDVSLLEMTAAYSTLASGGLYHEPTVVTRIEDRYGNVLHEASPRPQEALSERTAYTMVDMLRGVIDYGTGIRMRTQFQLGNYDLAGKTGTTQQAADTWFMLMHPELVTGAWVGFNDRRLHFRSTWWGQGSHTALLLVGDYFRRIADDSEVDIGDTEFPMAPAYAAGTAPQDTTTTDEGGGRVGW